MITQNELFSDESLAAGQASPGCAPRRLRHGGKWRRESAARWIVRETYYQPSGSWKMDLSSMAGGDRGGIYHDWRFWLAVILICGCVFLYAMSGGVK